MKKLILLLTTLPCMVLADVQYSGGAGIDQRYFLQDSLYPQQSRASLSGYFSPELYTDWNGGNDSILFKGFYRFDQRDEERTHGDIRELIWLHVGDEWELRAGIGKVFWGQTESQHLVDVINQTDAVEAIDGEDKLGQPMVSFSLIKDWGTTTLFALPYFRERTFSGVDGRFRGALPVDTDNPLFESEDAENNLDWAARWHHTLGDWEVGLSYFDGTAREPDFVLVVDEQLPPALRPYYPQMQQIGVDVLAVVDAWLIKFEGVQRDVGEQEYLAFVGGFEYTSVGIMDTVYDVGWLMEYQYDERKELATGPAQNDLMFGARFVFNNTDGTEVLMGYVKDLDYSSVSSGFIEASSRINDNWKWRLDAWLFSSDEPNEASYLIRRDDYLQLSMEYYF